MKLVDFRVRHFRSINDSGDVHVRELTALVGRNESGKTNLLLALASLKPPDGMVDLSFTKDFPRDRPRSEFSMDLRMIDSTWDLNAAEQADLARIFPRAKGVAQVTVARSYKATRFVRFIDLPGLQIDRDAVQNHLTSVSRSVNGSLRGVDKKAADAVKSALKRLTTNLTRIDLAPAKWADSAPSYCESFVEALRDAGFPVSDMVDTNLKALQQHAAEIDDDDSAHAEARTWVVKQLPVFIYLSDYPELDGHQDIPTYLQRKEENALTEADRNFEKLAMVADLDPVELDSLLAQSHEDRQLLTNRAGATVTRRLRELWTDRALTIRFALDAAHFDTLISDPNAVYNVEVNLDERSRGFKWFFSFYVTFAADTANGPAEHAIILLDEPGLHLHMTAQSDLLDHFAQDFSNQIIFTTHSPFMIPINDLPSVRTVNIDADAGTTVTNDPTGDYRTLFPLQAALGYDLTQTLFIGTHNLVVEGVSDFWYLSVISDYLRENGGQSLPEYLVLTPAGGAQKVSYMATLLAAQRLNVLVLLDDEKQARATADEIIRSKLIRSDSVIFVGEGLSTAPEGGADLEDLLDPQTFKDLVDECYSKELAATSITLNPNIPRIVKRYEDAFNAANIDFHKTRPAKLFLRRIAQDSAVVTPQTWQNFEALFTVISQRLQDLVQSDREPFR